MENESAALSSDAYLTEKGGAWKGFLVPASAPRLE